MWSSSVRPDPNRGRALCGFSECVEAGQSATDSPLDSGIQLLVALHGYATLRASSNDFPWPDADDLLDALISRLVSIDPAAVGSTRIRDPSSA